MSVQTITNIHEDIVKVLVGRLEKNLHKHLLHIMNFVKRLAIKCITEI